MREAHAPRDMHRATVDPTARFGRECELWTRFVRPRHPETRRNSGGDHVAYCTPPDAVEPAPGQVTIQAGRAGSRRFQQ
jgi:hypothetical protein